MAGSQIPRQRRPYRDACPMCPDTPRIPPVLVVVADSGVVEADYLHRCGCLWSLGWALDPQHERWSS
jgi:hypothetical protein